MDAGPGTHRTWDTQDVGHSSPGSAAAGCQQPVRQLPFLFFFFLIFANVYVIIFTRVFILSSETFIWFRCRSVTFDFVQKKNPQKLKVFTLRTLLRDVNSV